MDFNSSSKMNILLVMTDQMTPFMLKPCSGLGAEMTHLSALADRGVRFRNAYTTSPICAPARASLMTGLNVSRIGCYDNSDPIPSFVPTFAHYLTNQGYDVVLSGKMHFIGADQLHGFKRRLTTDVYPSDYKWAYPLERENDPDWKAFPFAPQFMCENIRPGWSTELQYDEETHFRALEYLRHAPDSPFMLTVSYTNPHPPYIVPEKYWNLYKDVDFPLPFYPDQMDGAYSEMDHALMKWYGLNDKSIQKPEHLLAMRRGFCALSHYIDDKLGELLAVLEQKGLRDNTLVIFTSDHGEMLGEKGLIQKRSLYEWSAHIPLIIDYPGGGKRTVETPVSLADIPATLLEVAGVRPVRPMDGRSLLPAIGGEGLEDSPIIAEYHAEGVMRPCFMVRKGPWKYIYIHRAQAQLFNLEEDPGEWNNLAGRPEVASLEKELNGFIKAGGFDPDLIEKDVWARLAQKQVVQKAMDLNKTSWDYRVDIDPATQYVRT